MPGVSLLGAGLPLCVGACGIVCAAELPLGRPAAAGVMPYLPEVLAVASGTEALLQHALYEPFSGKHAVCSNRKGHASVHSHLPQKECLFVQGERAITRLSAFIVNSYQALCQVLIEI